MSEKVRPFVKWAGGKGSLISQLNNFYPYELRNGIIERYDINIDLIIVTML